MTKPKRAAVVVAAGALVWRERSGVLEVLLIHRPRYDDWSWPKGKRDPGEAIPVTAVREVAEETGLEVALGVALPMLRYRVAGDRTKEVHYWAARELPAGSPARTARPPAPPSVDEVDELRWVPASEAAAMLTKKSDRKPLKALVTLHGKGQLDTRVVAVVRHARARSRSSWRGGEADRPLTQVGLAQARALVPVLSAFGVEHVWTSPWERCAATVAPFTEASGVPAGSLDALTEDAHATKPKRARRVAEAIYAGRGVRADDERAGGDVDGAADAAAARGSVAVCTHRPVLPTVFAALDAFAPGWVRQSRPRKDPYLRPASLAVAHLTRSEAQGEPRVVGFEVQAADDATARSRSRKKISR